MGRGDLNKKINKSVEIINRAAKLTNEPLIVNFSGGKDSLACLTLAKKTGREIKALYMDSGMELPNTLPFVCQRCKELGIELMISHPDVNRVKHKPNGPLVGCHAFADFVRHYGYWPVAGKRWCSIWLKQRPQKVLLRERFGRVSLVKLVGVRANESAVRSWKYGSEKYIKKYGWNGNRYIRLDKEVRGTYLIYPILDWTKEEVLAFLRAEGVEIHEGYKLFGVSGCKWCPIHRKETYEKILSVYPHLYNDLAEVEREIQKPAVRGGFWLNDIIAKLVRNQGASS